MVISTRWCMVLALAICASSPPVQRPLVNREYQVKAAFLYHFIGYVTWPKGALGKPKEPLRVGIIGVDPFGITLDKALARKPKKRSVKVERFGAWSKLKKKTDVTKCHVLFVAATETANVAAITKTIAKAPILVVCDDERGCPKGATIGFFIEKRKVRFCINRAALARARLTASSQLLKLGRAKD